MRDANRGVTPGQLDGEVEQGPPHLFRRVELKIGKNETTARQDATIDACTACGAPPIVAWTLQDVWIGLEQAGFNFSGNVETIYQQIQAELDGWNRKAGDILAGRVVKKRSATRKTGPRFVAGKKLARRIYAG
jgi:hypothetical protein